MKNLSRKEEVILQLKKFFGEKSPQHNIELVFLYGSWAAGSPHEDSDIDLAFVLSPKIVNEQEKFSLITDISYELSGNLNGEVNIIIINKDSPQPMLYYNAIVLGIPIFVANENDLLDLKLEALRYMEDFQIFGPSWQLAIANKLLRR